MTQGRYPELAQIAVRELRQHLSVNSVFFESGGVLTESELF